MGHFGIAKTLATLQEHFYWPHTKRDMVSPISKLSPECRTMVCIPLFLFLVNYGLIFQWILCWVYLGLDMGKIQFLLLSTDFQKWHILSNVTKLMMLHIAELFFKEIMRLHGLLRTIVFDRKLYGVNLLSCCFQLLVFLKLMVLLHMRKERFQPKQKIQVTT
jgi:hypothetical protein